MKQANETEVLFDDIAIIKTMHDSRYSGNISITDNMDCTNNINDCTNNINDCTNNFYVPLDDEKFNTAKSA